MLVEQGLVSPQRSREGAQCHNTADEVATRAGKLMKWVLICENFKENCALWDGLELVCEVGLPGISPSVDVIWLELQDHGPLWILLFGAVFGVLAPVLDRHGTNMVGCLG